MRRHVLFVVSTSGTAHLKATRRHATDAANGADIIVTTSVLVAVMTCTRRFLGSHVPVRPVHPSAARSGASPYPSPLELTIRHIRAVTATGPRRL